MKVNTLNINNLVTAANMLADTVDYLEATTELNKAASGRKTKEALIGRILTLRELADMAGQGTDYTLTDHEVEVVNAVAAHYTSTITKLVEEKAPEGETLVALPDWTEPKEVTTTTFIKGTILYAIATHTQAQADILAWREYMEAPMEHVKSQLDIYVKAINKHFDQQATVALDLAARKEFGAYLGIKDWRELGNAVEKLVNETNAKVSEPAVNEIILTLADFDRINHAVDALYPGGMKHDAGRRDDTANATTPMPHYARRTVTRQPTIQLKLSAGKITGIGFTDL